jgi:hypothetical protein
MRKLWDLIRQVYVKFAPDLSTSQPQPLQISQLEVGRQMSSLREDHRYKILQSLWFSRRGNLIAKGKEAKDGQAALLVFAEIRGLDAAVNEAMGWAKLLSDQDAKEKIKQKVAEIVNPTADLE